MCGSPPDGHPAPKCPPMSCVPLIRRFALTACVTALFSAAEARAEDGAAEAKPAPHAGVAAKSELVKFELDVMPILTKAGCNAGACHGKARGQNGFQLSLLGFD